MTLIKHEGNAIIEIVVPDIPTSTLIHQMVIAVCLCIYSMHWACIKNGLENDANAIPISFITIACIVGRTNNIIHLIGGIIGTFVIMLLISYIKDTRLFSKVFNVSHNVSHNVGLFITKTQRAMELEIRIPSIEMLQKFAIIGYNIPTELMDIFMIMIQHDMYESTLLQFFASLLRRYIRGISITLLVVTIATDVIEKCVTKQQIPANKEIGLKNRIIIYIMLSTIVIADAIITESHEIVLVLGIVGLIARAGIIFVVKFKNLPSLSQNSAENQTVEKLASSVAETAITMTANTNINATNRQRIYKMESKPCGIAIIINNEEFKISLESRSGSSLDAHKLWDLFNYLGFVTQCHNNKTHIEMRHILNDAAAMDHSKYDCLMVAILTHGNYGDLLYGTTGQGIVIQEIIETFSGRRCPTLIGKPKIFIIQACRGRRHNRVVRLNDNSNETIDSGTNVHPNISDYVVAYSTIPGHVSIRNNTGSIFISTLVQIFRQYATDEDLITMLERIIDKVTEYEPQGNGLQDSKQSPEVRSTLRRKVYFNTWKYKCD